MIESTQVALATYAIWVRGDRVYECRAVNLDEACRIARAFALGAITGIMENSRAFDGDVYVCWPVAVTSQFAGPDDDVHLNALAAGFETSRFPVLVELATGRDVTGDPAHAERADALGILVVNGEG
jgi:hypothetical protein